MGIRETINRRPGVAAGAAIIAVGLLVMVLYGFGDRRAAGAPRNAFYTTDDGATTFVDEAGKVPPFQHGGLTAVRAYKFRHSDGSEFVAYLERYRPEAKAALEAAARSGAEADLKLQEHYVLGREVKRPLDAKGRWIGPKEPQYNEIAAPAWMNGQEAQPVYP